MPSGRQHWGYQYVTPLGQLLAPICHYLGMLEQARKSRYNTVVFAMKDTLKKVPRIKQVEEKQPLFECA